MRINFARINHLLIPTTKERRDRWRRTAFGRFSAPMFFLYEALTLEGSAFATGSVIAIAFSLDVVGTDGHLLWAGLTAVVLASLLVRPLYRLTGVTLEVAPPRRASVGEEMTFTLTVRNGGPRVAEQLRVSGPFLPWDGRWTRQRPHLPALPPGGVARLLVRARFVERGEHHLDPFRVATVVPWGLSFGPAVYTEGCKFLVVPKVAQVVRVTTPLGQRHQPGGVALASKTGESMDLHGVRPYRPGDPVRDLHARSWARVGYPVVREYQQEYFSRIGVVVDTDLQRDPEELLEAALSLAAGVVGRLSRGEALIDLLVVGGQVHTLTLGRSLGSFEQALDLLACVQPGEKFDVDRLFERLQQHLSRLSCLVFVGLRWDAARAALGDRVRPLGVGCRAIVLGDPAGPAPGAQDEVTFVPLEAVRAGGALRL